MSEQKRWLPSYRLSPRGWAQHPYKKMLMTPILTFIGGLFAFAVTASCAALLQIFVFNPPVSNEWAPMNDQAMRGRVLFVSNGCMYCHSGFSRPQDVRAGLYYLYPRVSQPGDYFGTENSPNIFGSARLGPDLSNEGGLHPDDWHHAHFFSARYVDPLSIMPRFSFFSDQDVEDLTAFVQRRSGKSGLLRLAGEDYMKKLLLAVNNLPEPPKGFQGATKTLADVWQAQVNAPTPPGGNVDGLDWPDPVNLNIVDRSYWLVSNPLPVTKDTLIRGREIFQERCIGCHGEGGAAVSEAARFMSPTPINFTDHG
ncbi:MAG: cbb3-type cytochrome c oxidase subunit II, partial [Candidatus Aquicultor sp.]